MSDTKQEEYKRFLESMAMEDDEETDKLISESMEMYMGPIEKIYKKTIECNFISF